MGGVSDQWTVHASIRAAKKYAGAGREDVEADRPTSFTQVIWTIRRRTDIKAGMRINDGSYIYNILAIQQDNPMWTKIITDQQE